MPILVQGVTRSVVCRPTKAILMQIAKEVSALLTQQAGFGLNADVSVISGHAGFPEVSRSSLDSSSPHMQQLGLYGCSPTSRVVAVPRVVGVL